MPGKKEGSSWRERANPQVNIEFDTGLILWVVGIFIKGFFVTSMMFVNLFSNIMISLRSLILEIINDEILNVFLDTCRLFHTPWKYTKNDTQ